jgi:hypothetical protein
MVATAQQTPELNDLRWLVDEAVPGDSLLFFYSRMEKSGETCGLQQRNLGFHGDLMTFYGISRVYHSDKGDRTFFHTDGSLLGGVCSLYLRS